jgi:hypothetical protein
MNRNTSNGWNVGLNDLVFKDSQSAHKIARRKLSTVTRGQLKLKCWQRHMSGMGAVTCRRESASSPKQVSISRSPWAKVSARTEGIESRVALETPRLTDKRVVEAAEVYLDRWNLHREVLAQTAERHSHSSFWSTWH